MFLLSSRQKKLIFVFLITVTSFLSGCNFEEFSSVFQKENGVVFCVDSGVSSLDPLTSEVNVTSVTIAQNSYNRLVKYDQYFDTFKPELARKWIISPDQKVYRFYLNKDIYFHSVPWFTPSRPFNADDVIFTFNRLLDYTNPYELFQMDLENDAMITTTFDVVDFRHLLQLKKFVSKIVKINEYTVDFILNKPNPYFLEVVSNTNCVIESKEYFDSIKFHKKEDFFRNHIVGTGPFKQEDYQFNNYISLTANSDYWDTDKKPKLSKLVIDITPNRAKRMSKVITGECQVTNRPGNSNQLHEKFQHDYSILGSDSIDSTMIFFNTIKGPMSNLKIRQKIFKLINRNVYSNIIYPDSGIVPKTFFPFETTITNKFVNEYDKNRAIDVSKEINPYKKSRAPIIIYIEKSNSKLGYNSSRLGQLLVSDIKPLGLKTKIINADLRIIKRAVAQGNYDLIVFREHFPVQIPLVKFSHLFDCQDEKPASTNYASFCHDELIKTLDEIQYEKISDISMATFEKINRILSAHLPLVPITYSGDVFLYNKHVADMDKTVNNGLNFTEAYLR